MILTIDPQNIDTTLIQMAAARLREGGLVAFPTETVYGLGANALDPDAVDRIFIAKGRPATDPIIIHIADFDQIYQVVAEVPKLAEQLARQFWPGALTLILKRNPAIPLNVTAGQETVAVRMPDHPIALALIQAAGVPVAAPSANLFSRPSPTCAAHVLQDLENRLDMIIDGGVTLLGLESTVLDLISDPPRVLRPGGVPLEAIQALLPETIYEARYLNLEDGAIESPGTLIKHYSPRAAVMLFAGVPDRTLRKMRHAADEFLTEGRNVGVMIANGERVHFNGLDVEVFSLGADLDQIGGNLFAGLRTLDALGVDVILVREFPQEGIGLAIWDRLIRAAEGRIVS